MRLAGGGDAAEIRALVRAAYAKWVPVIGREPLPMRADYDEALRRHRFDVLERGAEMAAVIETERRDGHLWIENVAVRPDLQGQGLGRRLLAHADALARGLRLPHVRLLTNAAFEANVALYRRVGFEIERTEPFQGGTTVHMAKVLKPDP
jgi:ribosomal protein S18 acetylase RimI-like enzyme